MSESRPAVPIVYSPRAPRRLDIFRLHMLARTPVYRPYRGEDAAIHHASDAKIMTDIIAHDSGHHADAGGDVPFLDALDSEKLNALLGSWTGDPQQRMHFTLVHQAQGNAHGVAVVSPAGGFKQERLRRFSQSLRWRPTPSLPRAAAPITKGTDSSARSLYVATFGDMLAPSHGHEEQKQIRGLLGAMAAHHTLSQLPAETTIQYGFPNDRLGGACRTVLLGAMGMEPYGPGLSLHPSDEYAIAQAPVGEPGMPNTAIDNLVGFIEKTHVIN